MRKTVYVMVTQDKYSLPLMVCDSARTMSIKLGLKPDSVAQYVHHLSKRKPKYPRYIAVNIDDEKI